MSFSANTKASKRVNPSKFLRLISLCLLSSTLFTVARANESEDEVVVPEVNNDLNKKVEINTTDVDIPMTAKIANLAGKLPLAGTFRVKERILKLASFSSGFKQSLNKDYKVSAPLDQGIIMIFFIVCSYLPSLIFVALLSAFGCKKGANQATMDPTQFQYNLPEMGEIGVILKLVKELQQDVKTIQGGGNQAANNNAQPNGLTLQQFNDGMRTLIDVQQNNMRAANVTLENKVAGLEQGMQHLLTIVQSQQQTIASLKNHQPAQQEDLTLKNYQNPKVQPATIQKEKQTVPQLQLNGHTQQESSPRPQVNQKPPTPKSTTSGQGQSQKETEVVEYYYDEEDEDDADQA